jgi:hypothetical protein
MNDDPTTPGDDLSDRLRDGFHALADAAGRPSPLPDPRDGVLPRNHHARTRRSLVVAATVAILGAGVAGAIATSGDGHPKQQVNSGPASTTSTDASTGSTVPGIELPPPADTGKLICPPALLHIGKVEGAPKVVPPVGPKTSATPYQLTWKQDGRTVRLSYPGTLGGSELLIVGPQETVELSDGRSVLLEGRVDMTARVPALGRFDCESFEIQVDGSGGRQTLLDVAETVHISAPAGTVVVPDITGVTQADAQDVLARAGLVPGQPWVYGNLFGSPPVVSQDPTAGSKVAIGTTVHPTMATPATTTTTVPPSVEVDALPIPTEPLVCPMARLQVDDDFRSVPKVWSHTTVSWNEDGDMGGYQVLLSWPNLIGGGSIGLKETDPGFDSHGARQLTIQGRPALMHDDGDGQALVYDTGLPGSCRFLEIGVFGGPSIPERERRAEDLAAHKVTFAPPTTAAPPDVTGLTVAAAADRLARAGFIPDWGEHRALNEAPGDVPTAIVTAQSVAGPGVVRIDT